MNAISFNVTNLNYIFNRKQGEWLTADSQGRLRIVKGRFEKTVFLLKNYLSRGAEIQKLQKTIDDSFNNLLGYLRAADNPANEDDVKPLASIFKPEYDNAWQNVSRISSKILNPEQIKEIKAMSQWATHAETKIAMERGIKPELIHGGKSGVYKMHDRKGNPIAVFKPKDEERGCSNNPKGFSSPSLLFDGFRPGDGAEREVAASLIDQFGVVPKTRSVNIQSEVFRYGQGEEIYPKPGSLQQFVEGELVRDVYSRNPVELTKVNPVQLRGMVVNDLRWNSQDRHSANMIVVGTDIYQIDNGDTMPGYPFENRPKRNLQFMDGVFAEYLKQPFTEEEKIAIRNYDCLAEIRKLRANGIELWASSEEYMRVTDKIFKTCVEKGLTLYQIVQLLEYSHPLRFHNTETEINFWIKESIKSEIMRNYLDLVSVEGRTLSDTLESAELLAMDMNIYFNVAQEAKDFQHLAKYVVGCVLFVKIWPEQKNKELSFDEGEKVYKDFCELRASQFRYIKGKGAEFSNTLEETYQMLREL